MDEISDEQLISMAKEAAKKAYVPYSHFHVGSAVLSEDNYVYTCLLYTSPSPRDRG